MKLTVVGCAGSYPSADSPASCYLVEHEGHRILLDLGNGSFGALQRHVDLQWPGAVDAVVLSHCHLDHCADLGSMYVQRRYSPDPAADRLLVIGPSDARARLVGIYGRAEESGLDEQFEFAPYGREPMTVGPFVVEAVRAVHPVEAYSVRVSAGGASITYSGDTAVNERLVDLARGTDVALFEASFTGTGNPPGVHMTGAEAAATAGEAGAAYLLLTHLVAWNDPEIVRAEAAAVAACPFDLATPGMTITL